jgi:isocitrate lyase
LGTQVVRLRGLVWVEYSLARSGPEKLWRLLTSDGFVHTLGAPTGKLGRAANQGRTDGDLFSAWQVAVNANFAGEM